MANLENNIKTLYSRTEIGILLEVLILNFYVYLLVREWAICQHRGIRQVLDLDACKCKHVSTMKKLQKVGKR
jgi:hypothetical protein